MSAGRGVGVLVVVVAVFLLTACSSAGTGTTQTTIYIEAGSGTSAFYLVSDNVDPKSLGPDTSNTHTVSGLPNGSVQVCKYTVSQGVTWAVWSTGDADSTDTARAWCHQHGQ